MCHISYGIDKMAFRTGADERTHIIKHCFMQYSIGDPPPSKFNPTF